MSLWWLTASPALLREASTCRGCGCPDADIDTNLCFICFSREWEEQFPEPEYPDEPAASTTQQTIA